MINCKDTCAYIIFGAGGLGKELLTHLQDKVAFFCDNDKDKVGTYIDDIQVISFQTLLKINCRYNIIIAVNDYKPIKLQLEENGIYDYVLYESDNCKRGWRIIGESSLRKVNTHNEEMEKFVSQSQEVDPIRDYVEFRNLVTRCKLSFPAKELVVYEMHNSESTHYGYGKALMDYAGITEDYDRFPLVSHSAGFRYPNSSFQPYNFSIATIVSTEVFRREHNRRVPCIPIFTVGPYIRYANPTYAEKELEAIRKRNGTTVLIFISHSIETADIRYDWKSVIKHILKNYASLYMTVYVCAYWHDIDKQLYDDLNSAGIKVVSAGFRWDTSFIRRQRTLFELCDKVVFYGYSNALPFALALQKPTVFHDLNLEFDAEESTEKKLGLTRIHNESLCENYFQIIKNKLGNQCNMTEAERNVINDNFGLNIKHSKEYIRTIYKISCDIWRNCDYQSRYYPAGVYRTYWQYQDEYDFYKLNMLIKALGTGFLA